jgi:hypothetical protein
MAETISKSRERILKGIRLVVYFSPPIVADKANATFVYDEAVAGRKLPNAIKRRIRFLYRKCVFVTELTMLLQRGLWEISLSAASEEAQDNLFPIMVKYNGFVPNISLASMTLSSPPSQIEIAYSPDRRRNAPSRWA